MAEFSASVAELPKVRAVPHSATPGLLPGGCTLVGMNTDPDGQRKEDQQDIKTKLERSPIGEHAGHIEVEGQEHQGQQKHGGDKDHYGRHLIRSFFIRLTPSA